MRIFDDHDIIKRRNLAAADFISCRGQQFSTGYRRREATQL
jgi:hypothetical protein